MGKIPDKKQEIKYDPKFFIEDLINIVSMFNEKARLMNEIEFSEKQKTFLAGTILGFTCSLLEINKKLQEWGFLPK